MDLTKIGNTTVVSDDDGPFALVYHSARHFGDRPVNVDWTDEVNGMHFSTAESVKDGIQFLETRMAAIETIRQGCDLLCPVTDEIASPLPSGVIEGIIRRIMGGESLPDILDSTSELSMAAS